jgi:glycosyltransferase involved in cell wall biosynthesis
MRIAILGTRGIPNYYGGFEQFAEYLAKILIEKGHDVTVYNSHYHPYQEREWNGVQITHKYDPENKIGTAGQFIYDLNCILDTRKRNYEIILQLGYTSSSIWGKLLPRRKSLVVTNMDGLEWKRSKYNWWVRKFLLFAEKLGIKYSDALISDSIGIQDYLKKKYSCDSTFIPYGTHRIYEFDEEVLKEYELKKYEYAMLIARLEPENNIEVILDGVKGSGVQQSFLVIGNHNTDYGRFLKCKYKDVPNIRFMGGIYDIDKLNSLRYYCKVYFHGHSVGGTNPSLIEAIGSGAFICAHENVFNKAILEKDALYFNDSKDVESIFKIDVFRQREDFRSNNWQKVETKYLWQTIADQHEELFFEVMKMKEQH